MITLGQRFQDFASGFPRLLATALKVSAKDLDRARRDFATIALDCLDQGWESSLPRVVELFAGFLAIRKVE